MPSVNEELAESDHEDEHHENQQADMYLNNNLGTQNTHGKSSDGAGI